MRRNALGRTLMDTSGLMAEHIQPLPEETQQKAREFVAGYATDADDLRDLLSVLGLMK